MGKGGIGNEGWLTAAQAAEPVGFQPRLLSRQGLAAGGKVAKHGTTHRRKISRPASLLVRLDVRCG